MVFKQLAWALHFLALIVSISLPFSYVEDALIIDGYNQELYTFTIDMNRDDIVINHGFSSDLFYGFEKTSDIAKRHNSKLAINGMFYNSYGMPYGIMIDNKKVLGINSTGGPVFYIDQHHKVHISDIAIEGYVSSDREKIQLWGVNSSAPQYSFVLYDSLYGRTTRVYRNSINYIIKDSVVIDIIETDTAVTTESGDYILTHITDSSQRYFVVGEEIDISYSYVGNYEDENLIIEDAFQGVGWLVYESENVAKDYEPYIGFTTSLQPRTLIGITNDNQLVLMIVDGRNSNISAGVTGKQAGDLMSEAGCIYAFYLDGGASSTMVYNGELINRPSEDGEEREIAHCILFDWNGIGDK